MSKQKLLLKAEKILRNFVKEGNYEKTRRRANELLAQIEDWKRGGVGENTTNLMPTEEQNFPTNKNASDPFYRTPCGMKRLKKGAFSFQSRRQRSISRSKRG
jgi:hypothetical protein